MNNLIKNELIKIFHKKAIYVVLIITIIFMILNIILTKIYNNDNFDIWDQDISFYEEQISSLDKNNPEERDLYISYEVQLEIAKLIKKYGRGSWQEFVINTEGNSIIQNLKYSENSLEYKKNKEEYDEFIKKLDNEDWTYYAKEELKNVNAEIVDSEKMQVKDILSIELLKLRKQALEWRLEKNISYGNSNLSNLIESWINNKQSLNEYENMEKRQNVTYQHKYEKQELITSIGLAEYAIKNNVNENMKDNYIGETCILATEADSDLINAFSNYSIFILIAIMIIAGTIVSEEFNKGTIKLLLVRPYKRTKILIAKFVSCLIILILVSIAIIMLQTVVGGVIYGFDNYSSKVIIFNHNVNVVQECSLIKYVILILTSKFPKYVLLMTLAFSISTVLKNTPIAIAVPLIGNIGGEIINQISYQYEKAKILKYFVSLNWDWSMYLYGKLPKIQSLSLTFSMIICAIYFIIMIATSLYIFRKTDIKNI